MSRKKSYIEVRTSVEQIKERLVGCMKGTPHAALIAETIVDGLADSEMGLSHLYNAFSGLKPSVHVKIGDDVLIPWDNMPTWRMNKDKMREAGLLVKETLVKAVVVDINHNRRESIQVRYERIDESGKSAEDSYSCIPDVVFNHSEEYPENLSDDKPF